mmetsp:Transcript_17909/g.55626  ORF Transcript_17909/g.55626 Transcript_17909/m.55626 type:complete len:261 (-) Transcript_17909:67-849(-)
MRCTAHAASTIPRSARSSASSASGTGISARSSAASRVCFSRRATRSRNPTAHTCSRVACSSSVGSSGFGCLSNVSAASSSTASIRSRRGWVASISALHVATSSFSDSVRAACAPSSISCRHVVYHRHRSGLFCASWSSLRFSPDPSRYAYAPATTAFTDTSTMTALTRYPSFPSAASNSAVIHSVTSAAVRLAASSRFSATSVYGATITCAISAALSTHIPVYVRSRASATPKLASVTAPLRMITSASQNHTRDRNPPVR